MFGVILIHYGWFGHDLLQTIGTGSRGVDLFFVISGFLITLGLIKSREKEPDRKRSFYKFYIRRFLRIFPLYYLFLFCVWLFFHYKVAGSMWWYILYASNFHSIRIQDWGGLGHLWSLAVEEQFYFVWPFLILLVPIRGLPVMMILSILLSLAAKSYWRIIGAPFWQSYMSTVSCLDTLGMGGVLAYCYHYYPERLRSILYNPIVIAILFGQLLLIYYLFYLPRYDFIFHIGIRASFGLFAAWLIGRSVYGFTGITGAILNNSILRYLGTISYGLYLIHPIVPDIIAIDFIKSQNLRAFIYICGAIGIATASWYFFESRILKLKEKFE